MVEEGTNVSMQGPLGAFLVDRTTDKPYLFVATGTGIAPFRSQVHWLLKAEGETRPINLVFGLRQRDHMFLEDEWKELERAFPNFHMAVSFLDGSPDWHGQPVNLQDRVCELLGRTTCSVSICGGPETVKALKESCLTKWHVPKEDVHVESYV